MFKHLLIILALVSFFSAFTLAQERPETEIKEKQECSKSCCGKSESQSNMQMKKSSETATVQIWNKVCPVKGEEVDAEAPTFEYKGKVIGFCCPGCGSKFKKDPENYMKNLNEDGTKFIGKS